ncbi:MAG: tetratricopeptide repeat protein [Phycisphaerae bacterium]
MRSFTSHTVLLTLLVGLAQAAPQTQETGPDERSVAEDPAATIGAREAARRAEALFAQLANDPDDDAREKMLADVDRYVDIVQRADPDNPRLLYLKGRRDAVVGREADALRQLRAFVQRPEGRDEWRAFRVLGDLLAEAYPRLAEANYRKAAELNSREPAVLHGLCNCAARLGNLDKAVRLAREAVRADGRKTVRYLSSLAMLLRASRHYDEAIREATAALELARRRVTERPGERGPLADLDAQYRVVTVILRSHLAEPDHDPVTVDLALAGFMRKRMRITRLLALHDVLEVLQDAMDAAAPDPPTALLREYGIVLSELGRTDEAISVFKRILARDPADAEAANQLARLRADTAGKDVDPP